MPFTFYNPTYNRRKKTSINLRKTRQHRKRLENEYTRRGHPRTECKEFAHHPERWSFQKTRNWLLSLGYRDYQAEAMAQYEKGYPPQRLKRTSVIVSCPNRLGRTYTTLLSRQNG